MNNTKIELIADFISKSKTKKFLYTLKDKEIENDLKVLFLEKSQVELSIVSVSDTYTILIEIIKLIKSTINLNNAYTLEEFKFSDDVS